MEAARGLLGIAVLVGIAWLMSSNRRRFPWKLVVVGLALQWALAWLVLGTETGRAIFDTIGRVVTVVLRGADEAPYPKMLSCVTRTYRKSNSRTRHCLVLL